MSHCVEVTTPAKVNLGLEILGKRSDGFHEIRTVMAMIDLSDRLVVFEDDQEANGMVAGVAGNDNLIRRALAAFRSRVPYSPALGWEIDKHIPAAAGLGGASSNAAAALLAANLLAGEPLGIDDLRAIASSLGSDIPFFFGEPVGLASGRGTDITPLPHLNGYLVIVVPAIEAESKTASMYGNLLPDDFSDGSRTEAAAALISAGKPLTRDHLRNAFSRAAMTRWPQVDDVQALFGRLGVQLHALSGAGPSCYALMEDRNEARALEQRILQHLPTSTRTFVTGFRSSPLVVMSQELPDA